MEEVLSPRRIFFVEGMMIRVLVLDFVVIRHVLGHDLVLPREAVLRAIVLRRFIADASAVPARHLCRRIFDKCAPLAMYFSFVPFFEWPSSLAQFTLEMWLPGMAASLAQFTLEMSVSSGTRSGERWLLVERCRRHARLGDGRPRLLLRGAPVLRDRTMLAQGRAKVAFFEQ